MSTPPKKEITWPPKSPYEVLMSTQWGRKCSRHQADQILPSISSSKGMKLEMHQMDPENSNINDLDDDDEETLQLQLQEIQARLKLKKIQKRKREHNPNVDLNINTKDSYHKSRFDNEETATENWASPKNKLHRSEKRTFVDVPVSPVKRKLLLETQRSPSRVLLGIDKGLKGRDVSLLKTPNLGEGNDDLFNRKIGLLGRSKSPASTLTDSTKNILRKGSDRPKSFNQKLAAVRRECARDRLKQLQNEKCRNTAFDIDQNQMYNLKRNAVEFTCDSHEAPKFSRDEVLNSFATNKETLPRTTTNSSGHLFTGTTKHSKRTIKDTQKTGLYESNNLSSLTSLNQSTSENELEALNFEPYSSQHLRKRIIPHKALTRSFSGKKIYLIPDLLREVVDMNFRAPDIDQDLVVLAIIASKSEPKSHRSGLNKQTRGKFMALTLTDLKWELDLYLFDSAFDKFWKITPGTILAILNPLIMPPPRDKIDSNKFSIMLNSDVDNILEIGIARDLGFCKSVKRDGKSCGSWVDKRHTEFCEYHVNAVLNKTRASRMEINTMTFGNSKYGVGGTEIHKSEFFNLKDNAKMKQNEKCLYDRISHSQIYISQKTAANLLDDVDYDPDNFHRGNTKEERMMKQILTKEKEKRLEKRLAEIGTGLGAEYAKIRQTGISLARSTDCNDQNQKLSHASPFGFLERDSKDVTLSPVKTKRRTSLSTSIPKGWGKELKMDLRKIKNSESLVSSKKKTRFITERGIKEAGRESLDVDTIISLDSDDDLEIIRN